jgi:hypothetical protein
MNGSYFPRSLLSFPNENHFKFKVLMQITQGDCAPAGKTAGGVRFSLIFLFLFVSRQKEKEHAHCAINKDKNYYLKTQTKM